jgi:hypothetical protein
MSPPGVGAKISRKFLETAIDNQNELTTGAVLLSNVLS